MTAGGREDFEKNALAPRIRGSRGGWIGGMEAGLEGKACGCGADRGGLPLSPWGEDRREQRAKRLTQDALAPSLVLEGKPILETYFLISYEEKHAIKTNSGAISWRTRKLSWCRTSLSLKKSIQSNKSSAHVQFHPKDDALLHLSLPASTHPPSNNFALLPNSCRISAPVSK